MMTTIGEFVLLFAIAIIANGLSAIAGGGAGLLQLPIILFLGLPFGIALATHKIATVALGIGSSFRYLKENFLTIRFAIFALGFGLPGVIIGARTILAIDEDLAIFSLGVLTLGLGIYSLFKKQLGREYHAKNHTLKGYVIGGSIIFIIGFLNGSLTSGTGLFFTLWLIFWFGLDYQRAIAITMILVGFFWNATGAITLALISEVKWSWLIPLVSGSLIGGYLGAHFALAKGNRWIKAIFEILTIAVGISLIIKASI